MKCNKYVVSGHTQLLGDTCRALFPQVVHLHNLLPFSFEPAHACGDRISEVNTGVVNGRAFLGIYLVYSVNRTYV